MQKLINNPLAAADELLDGLVDAYNGECSKVGTRSIVKNNIPKNKVALLVGGGAGHEPIYHGMVGKNMADGAACGDIFAAPSPNIIHEATSAIQRGNGVLYLYGNYAGDNLNFDLGAEISENEGIRIETIRIADDVASAPANKKHERRGIAGLVPIVKIASAASQTAASLDELVVTTKKACLQTKSIGLAISPGSIPATGKPTFVLEKGEVGLGMGIHGEAGVAEVALGSANEMTLQMLEMIITDFNADTDVADLTKGDEIIFFINSLGATTMMECLICMRKAREYFDTIGVKIFDTIIGPLVTCQEMAGMSFSITRVDDELKDLWSMPCESLCFSKMQGPNNIQQHSQKKQLSNKTTTTPNSSTPSQQIRINLSKSSEGLNIEQTRNMLDSVADAIIAAEPILSDADRALGDGDHGLGMQRGFIALKKAIGAPCEKDTLDTLFSNAGNALLSTMGGASGVIFGSLFLAGKKTLKGATHFGSHELSHLLEHSLANIVKRGGAKRGDKTMIDALAPASDVTKIHINDSLKKSITAAATAAIKGKNDSCEMIATTGRAKTLGEKTLGLPDAGAISVSIILTTMQQFICSSST